MNTQITQGNYGAGQVNPLNATGGPATAGSITATIDNYAAAYVAPGAQSRKLGWDYLGETV